ncbi:MAG: biopolymer transporter ExbD [Treponema sp.]|nr:biopolymer transporter ExbD [Treponema sp.]
MKLKARRSGVKATVDMTPMLDVVFQLIIFFLVSTTFAVLPGIKLKLPESTTAESTSNLGITITMEKNGAMWFNDTSVNMEKLSDMLKNFDTQKTKRNEFPVAIEADGEVTNGKIVELFDVIRSAGFSSISLRTKNKK